MADADEFRKFLKWNKRSALVFTTIFYDSKMKTKYQVRRQKWLQKRWQKGVKRKYFT